MIQLTPTIHIYERSDWHARQPSGAMATQAPPHEAFVHHGAEGNAEVVDTLEEQITAMKEIQDFHMNERGWSDIAYHYVIFQSYHPGVHARIFEGRHVSNVPAAQLGHNTGTFAVCIYGNFQNDDQFKDNTRYALELLLDTQAHLMTVGGHRDVVLTSCPGDTVYNALPRIARATNLSLYKK